MIRRNIFIFFAALGALSALAQNTGSEPEQAGDTLYNDFHIEEVEVTARALTKDIIIPQTLKGEELQRLNALTVADAIRYFSGVQLKDYGGVGGIKTINVRSMGSQHTAVYYNGVQLGNAQNGQVDLGRFSLDNLEQIQLYKGQKSDIFQSAKEFGAAGNVYLTTRKPYFKTGERTHVRAQMRFGSFALANPNVGVDVKLTDALSLTLDAEYVYSNGKYPFRYKRVLPDGTTAYDTTAVRQNGDINAVRAELGLHHYYRTTGFWRVHVYNYWSERGVPGAIVNNVWRNGERLRDRNTFVQGTWQDVWWNRWSTRLLLKYANDYTHYKNYDEKLLPSNNEYLQQEVYLSLANKIQVFNWWDLSVAYDYQYNALNRENLLLENSNEFFDRHSHWLSAATAFNIKEYLRLQASVLMTAIQNRKSKIENPKIVNINNVPVS
jgi:outer membrane cobalamin receptor